MIKSASFEVSVWKGFLYLSSDKRFKSLECLIWNQKIEHNSTVLLWKMESFFRRLNRFVTWISLKYFVILMMNALVFFALFYLVWIRLCKVMKWWPVLIHVRLHMLYSVINSGNHLFGNLETQYSNFRFLCCTNTISFECPHAPCGHGSFSHKNSNLSALFQKECNLTTINNLHSNWNMTADGKCQTCLSRMWEKILYYVV